jgi:hypothetical protein
VSGCDNQRELRELMCETARPGEWRDWKAFGLESGADQLALHFDTVMLRRFPDALEITAVEPLLTYLRSRTDLTPIDEERLSAAEAVIAAEIRASGAFHVTKEVGMLLAQR